MHESAATVQFTCYSVFARRGPAPAAVAAQTEALIESLSTAGITTRGLYDVHGMPANADLLVWLHGPAAEALQQAQRDFQRRALGDQVELVWSGFGVHRQAEFSRQHIPAFLQPTPPKHWLTVYPFVRSYQWYLLPESERRALLAEHGKMGREFGQVLSNTVAAFALGDYEWLLALEADELVDLTDLMRHLRGSGARAHVRLEVPFFTGHRIEPADLPELLG